jgi:hypothetical protein
VKARLNAEWHMSHRLPPRASLDERVRWHLAHAKACGCRAIPETVAAELRRRSLARTSRSPIPSRRKPKSRTTTA